MTAQSPGKLQQGSGYTSGCFATLEKVVPRRGRTQEGRDQAPLRAPTWAALQSVEAAIGPRETRVWHIREAQ